MLLSRKAALALASLLILGNSCGITSRKTDNTTLAAAGSSQIPLYDGSGFNDRCIGCIAWWALQEDPNKTNDAIYDWNAMQRKCRQKGQCGFFDYTNAWSPFLAIDRIVNGPAARWAEWRDAAKKVACFYADPYFTGKEACYESPVTTRLPEGLAGKVSSFRLINIKSVGVSLKGAPIQILTGDGFNLIEDHNDSIEEVSF